MKLLLADDDPMFCRLAQKILARDYELVLAHDGEQAWQAITTPPIPSLALLNWIMPKLEGLELCRRIRAHQATARAYVLLITAKARTEDIVRGLEAGADDYIVKPFQAAEFRARVQVGARIVRLQDALADRIAKLEEALQQVDTLGRLLPICSYCHSIRDDRDYWEQLESYLSKHSHLEFTHGVCPTCYAKHLGPELAAQRGGR